MPETTARELKLVQYLNEAYGKEKQLETVLQAQIKLMQKPVIKKRLQDHLKETKAQAKGLERRIKQLGGKADAQNLPGPDLAGDAVGAVASVANKAMAAAKGPVQALRGTSPADNMLRNMRDAFWNEAEEIAHYNLIEALAEQLKDRDTVKLAKEFRRQEERMQSFIEKQMPGLVKDVVKSEVPKAEREPASSSSSRSSSSRSTSRSSASSSRSSSRSSGTKSSGTKASGTKSSSRSSGTRSSAAKSSGTKSSGSRSSGTKSAASSRSSASKSGGSRSNGSKSSGSSRSRAKSGSGSGSGSSGSGSSS